jgi:hypothetical protein
VQWRIRRRYLPLLAYSMSGSLARISKCTGDDHRESVHILNSLINSLALVAIAQALSFL